MADTNKKYGLFLPNKNKKSAVKTTNVFDDDSDDDLPGMAKVNATINKEAQKSKVKRQTQLAIDQALEQDPNVYEYDKIYDSMMNTKAETEEAAKAKKDNKPKYIANLMKAAEKRKLEQEKVQEKKIQKERETEGGEFDDKEVFVTGKYREKLQEMEKEAERERREEAMEELLDVKKQKDMSGFYRYLLNEKTGESIHNRENSEANVKTEPGTEVDTSRVKTEPKPKEESVTTNRAKRNSSYDSSDDSSDSEQTETRYDKGRNHSSWSPNRRKRSRSSDRRKRSRSGDRRKSRSPKRLHREKDKNKSSDSKHRHSQRSRSNDRHSHKDKKHRSSSRDRTSTSSKRSRSGERKTEYKDQLSGSKERSLKQKEGKEVSLPEKNTEGQSGKSEMATKDSESTSKYAKHTTDKTLNDAKARYLARQLAKEKARSAVNMSGDI